MTHKSANQVPIAFDWSFYEGFFIIRFCHFGCMLQLMHSILLWFRTEEEKREAARRLEEWREEKRRTKEEEEERRVAEEIQIKRREKVVLFCVCVWDNPLNFRRGYLALDFYASVLVCTQTSNGHGEVSIYFSLAINIWYKYKYFLHVRKSVAGSWK